MLVAELAKSFGVLGPTESLEYFRYKGTLRIAYTRKCLTALGGILPPHGLHGKPAAGCRPLLQDNRKPYR
jgi:hypothetical protein